MLYNNTGCIDGMLRERARSVLSVQVDMLLQQRGVVILPPSYDFPHAKHPHQISPSYGHDFTPSIKPREAQAHCLRP